MLLDQLYDPFKTLPQLSIDERQRYFPITVTEYYCAKQYSKIVGYTPNATRIERSCLTLRKVPAYTRRSGTVGNYLYQLSSVREVTNVVSDAGVTTNSIPTPDLPAYTITYGNTYSAVRFPTSDATDVPANSYCVDAFPRINDDICKGTGLIILPSADWGNGVPANRKIFEVVYTALGSQISSNNVLDIQDANTPPTLVDGDNDNLLYQDASIPAPTTTPINLVDLFNSIPSASQYTKKFFGFKFNISTSLANVTNRYVFISFFDIMKRIGNDDYFNFAFSNGMQYNEWISSLPAPFNLNLGGASDVSSSNLGTVDVSEVLPTAQQDVTNTEIQKISLDKVAGVYFRLKFNVAGNQDDNYKIDTVTFIQYEPKQYGNNYLYRDTDTILEPPITGEIPKTPPSLSLIVGNDDPYVSDIAGTFLRRIDFGKENITPLQFTENVNIALTWNPRSNPSAVNVSRFIVSKIRTYTRNRKVLNSVIYKLFQGKSMINFTSPKAIRITIPTSNILATSTKTNAVLLNDQVNTGMYDMPRVDLAINDDISNKTWGSKYVRRFILGNSVGGNADYVERLPLLGQNFANAYLYIYR